MQSAHSGPTSPHGRRGNAARAGVPAAATIAAEQGSGGIQGEEGEGLLGAGYSSSCNTRGVGGSSPIGKGFSPFQEAPPSLAGVSPGDRGAKGGRKADGGTSPLVRGGSGGIGDEEECLSVARMMLGRSGVSRRNSFAGCSAAPMNRCVVDCRSMCFELLVRASSYQIIHSDCQISATCSALQNCAINMLMHARTRRLHADEEFDDGRQSMGDGWVVREGEFVSVMAVATSCRSDMTKKGVCFLFLCVCVACASLISLVLCVLFSSAVNSANEKRIPVMQIHKLNLVIHPLSLSNRHRAQRPPLRRSPLPHPRVQVQPPGLPALPHPPVQQGPGGRLLPVREGVCGGRGDVVCVRGEEMWGRGDEGEARVKKLHLPEHTPSNLRLPVILLSNSHLSNLRSCQ